MPRKGPYDKDPTHRPRSKTPATQPQGAQAHGVPTGVPHKHPSCEVDNLDALVGNTFLSSGIIFRVTADREGKCWYKACIRTSAFPRHYLLASTPPGVPFSTGIRLLAEKVWQFEEGTLKPSPDTWPG